jgi:hypothetical protein
MTELKAWRHDPLAAAGGFIPTFTLLIAFGLLFGGRLTFKIAIVNDDSGPYGLMLRETFDAATSPFGTPYYDVEDLSADAAWEVYEAFRLDGIWIIPSDFSERVESGQNPAVEMVFNNYNDDRAKNHRIYAAEILWRFYERVGYPAAPLAMAEEYPMPVMVAWFPVIAVGIILLGVTIGGMFNIYMLTFKEQTAGITLEFGLAPRSLLWVLAPKALLALLMALATGTVLLGVCAVWPGIWPGKFIWGFWLLSGLTALFWIALALLVGLNTREYMPGAIASILTGLTVFFIGGGLSIIRNHEADVLLAAWFFPNTYAVDPLRDLILFHTMPADWNVTLLKLSGFAILAIGVGFGLASRQLRRL